MTKDQIVYLTFGVVLILALAFDLGLLSKKNKVVTIKQALWQTFFWVSLGLAFFVFMWLEEGQKKGLEYLSAYLMEWSLSIDNIFVFILIFDSFSVKEKYYSRVLLIGIGMAIILRILFITVGVAIVDRFEWVLLIFGAFLIYTGYKMFVADKNEKYDPHETSMYKLLNRFLPLAPHDGDGKYIIRVKGKPQYTTLFVVVIILASVDIVFALDSIPAVMGISRDPLVIYTSNIFAVLGLRSLFFLLKGAVNKFAYLQQGIAVILVFIGLKMLGEHWLSEWMSSEQQVILSLGVILSCILLSILYSIYKQRKAAPQQNPPSL